MPLVALVECFLGVEAPARLPASLHPSEPPGNYWQQLGGVCLPHLLLGQNQNFPVPLAKAKREPRKASKRVPFGSASDGGF